jgi:hypothetical protein
MAKRYTVKSSTLDDVVHYDDGDMNKWVLTLADDDGNEVSDVAHWRPASQRKQSFAEGDQIEADIQNQPRGGVKLANPKLVGGDSPNGSAPSGGGTQVLDYTRQDATGRSIEKQVALKVAGEIAAAYAGQSGNLPTAEKVALYAEELDEKFLGKLPPAPEGTEPAEGNKDDDIPF